MEAPQLAAATSLASASHASARAEIIAGMGHRWTNLQVFSPRRQRPLLLPATSVRARLPFYTLTRC